MADTSCSIDYIYGMQPATLLINLHKVSENNCTNTTDLVAVEEPLEISVAYSKDGIIYHKTISVTMRTPGHDAELAAGFLFTEGIIRQTDQISNIVDDPVNAGTIKVVLKEGTVPDLRSSDRHFYTTSSCGVCGKSSIDAIFTVAQFSNIDNPITLNSYILPFLSDRMMGSQQAFTATGGLHASALFSTSGEIISLREDVGRHNALDKLIGNALMQHQLPLQQAVLLLSGRASFELVQKAAMAGIPIVISVGAPSSLAIQLAQSQNITLIGFLKKDRFNIYCHQHRIVFNSNNKNET